VGPDRNTHLRNIAIVVVLAVAVWQLPGGGTAAAGISNVLSIIFLGGIVFFAYRLYMERRDDLFGLGDRQRGLLYGSLALLAFLLVATRRMWDLGAGGGLLWAVLMGAGLYGLYVVFRAYRAY
jgi:hypothetical protein